MEASSATRRLLAGVMVRDLAWWRLPWLLRCYVGALPPATLVGDGLVVFETRAGVLGARGEQNARYFTVTDAFKPKLALTDGTTLLFHAEDIGRHNAVDKVIGAAVLARTKVVGRGLLVTGRISAELAFKAARAGLAWVATPSVPSTLAVTIADRSGMVLVGRAVSGTPHVHKHEE